MSSARVRQKRFPKPPACDPCKARRVLCHPQPNGAPCPRCVEKSTVCTTTPVPRGRPRKYPKPKSARPPESETDELESSPAIPPTLSQASSSSLSQSPTQAPSPIMTQSLPQVDDHTPELISKTPAQASSSPPNHQVSNTLGDCPDLTPGHVAHFFDCFFGQLSLGMNPLIVATSIKEDVQAASFRLSLLSPQVRVLALCIIALASRISFHEAILGPGPRPASFTDPFFFLASNAQANVRNCGARRAKACRALHAAALKAAWDTGIILQVSPQNAASCFLLDILEQDDFVGLARPWACAYMSHVRALAPMWRSSGTAPPDSSTWAGFLMAEALMSTRSRKPILITLEDQLLLSGSEPPSIEELLASVKADNSGVEAIFQIVKPYMFHTTVLARQLWTTITGDRARFSPLSESAVLQFLSALSNVHALLSQLLTRVDAALQGITTSIATERRRDRAVRGCAYGLIIGFVGLVLPLHRELEFRLTASDVDVCTEPGTHGYAHARMRLLAAEVREMAGRAVREVARALRYLPPVHYAPIQRPTLVDCAQFALEQAEAAPVVDTARVQDLITIASQLRIIAYSFDLPETALLLAQIDRFVEGTPIFNSAGLGTDVCDDECCGEVILLSPAWKIVHVSDSDASSQPLLR